MSGREIRIDVDLSIDRSTREQLLENTNNVPYTSITVISVTPGATFELGAGRGSPTFPYAVGDRWEVDDHRCDPPVTDGIYIKNGAQPLCSVTLHVGQGAQRSGGN